MQIMGYQKTAPATPGDRCKRGSAADDQENYILCQG